MQTKMPAAATTKTRTQKNRLARIVEVPHLVTVVCDKMQKIERLIACIHSDICLPSQQRLVAHDVAARQPAQVAELQAILLILIKQAFQ